MQKDIILFFLSIANPVFDFIANCASFLGEESFVILILGWILYNYDKEKGFAVGSCLLSSLVFTGIAKALVKAPRPFQVLKEVDGKRLATATGYSFPSGHTTCAASMYSSTAFAIKKRVISILCAIAIVLVGISRMYLGVHWPLDVFTGLLIGIMITVLFYPIFLNIAQNKKSKLRFSLVLAIITGILAILLTILLQNNTIDTVAFADPMKTISLAFGAYLGFIFEIKKIDYKVEGSISIKIIRIILLLIGAIIIQIGIKLVIPESLYYFGALIRYSLLGLYLTFLFPLIFKKLFK